ncbi:hypothetical protein [Spiroplasma phoeniceum]|uniref:Uncharacterized protein n=1 Tax=Spiroplasma phoeniceum P40 TaxID=1276259 RepID=A0A345DQC1_9MOLU|nr:hypothetical protein [Spiroplasma phoeniceum]AXF96412.1 hypothetical protein SDAV_001445 [Spiroplasma phoeniceum P40]
MTGFQVEFANLNQMLRNKYSNYYGDTMPLLLLDDNNILFRLYDINFDKITKLIKRTPQAILGIMLKVTIPYEVKFKKLYNNGIIDNEVVISNNLDVLSNIQESLLDYFLIFIDELFKKQEYKIIVNLEQNIIMLQRDDLGSQLVSKCIRQKLREEGILFSSFVLFNYDRFVSLRKRTAFDRSTAIWAWAGEGYNPMKLTPEKFLKFYKKRTNLENHNNDYYLKANIYRLFIDRNFMIEKQ